MTPLELSPEPAPAAGAGDAAVPDLAGKQGRKRRRRQLLLLLLVGLLLAGVVAIGVLLMTGGSVTTIPGLTGSKLPHYDFSIYGAARPIGVAVSPSGDRIYVTESDGTRLVKVYDRAGKHVDTLAPRTSNLAGRTPVYVAVDPVTGSVYVSDRPSRTVAVYDAKGTYRRTFRPPAAALGGGWQPLGVAFDAQGALYVSDVSGPFHRVLVFGRGGRLVRTLGSPGQLSFPNGIAIDRRGNVYVSDSNNGRLVIFDPAGKLVTSINRGVGQGDLGLPRGVAIDSRKRLYVVDTTGQLVQVYHLQDEGSTLPSYVGSFGEEGQREGTFEYPNGVAADGRDRIYVTDRENNRVQVWSY